MKVKVNNEILEFCQMCTPTKRCGWDCWIFKYKDCVENTKSEETNLKKEN